MQLNIEKPNENKGLNNIIKNKKMNTIKMKCDFDECDYQKFELGDNLVIFKECNHCYHKDCFQNIKNIYENDNNKFYIDNNFCPKCFDII